MTTTYGEREFGAFNVFANRVMWKIDCYDPELKYGSDGPGDPAKTKRPLTIMLAERA